MRNRWSPAVEQKPKPSADDVENVRYLGATDATTKFASIEPHSLPKLPELKEQVTMIRRVFLTFLVFGMVGCGGVDVTDPGSVSGTYTLQTVNGDALPAVLFQDETTLLEVTAGSITLNQDRSCSTSMSLRQTQDGVVATETETGVCTYALDSGSITVTDSANPLTPTTGSLTGSSITVTDDGDVFVYQK